MAHRDGHALPQGRRQLFLNLIERSKTVPGRYGSYYSAYCPYAGALIGHGNGIFQQVDPPQHLDRFPYWDTSFWFLGPSAERGRRNSLYHSKYWMYMRTLPNSPGDMMLYERTGDWNNRYHVFFLQLYTYSDLRRQHVSLSDELQWSIDAYSLPHPGGPPARIRPVAYASSVRTEDAFSPDGSSVWPVAHNRGDSPRQGLPPREWTQNIGIARNTFSTSDEPDFIQPRRYSRSPSDRGTPRIATDNESLAFASPQRNPRGQIRRFAEQDETIFETYTPGVDGQRPPWRADPSPSPERERVHSQSQYAQRRPAQPPAQQRTPRMETYDESFASARPQRNFRQESRRFAEQDRNILETYTPGVDNQGPPWRTDPSPSLERERVHSQPQYTQRRPAQPPTHRGTARRERETYNESLAFASPQRNSSRDNRRFAGRDRDVLETYTPGVHGERPPWRADPSPSPERERVHSQPQYTQRGPVQLSTYAPYTNGDLDLNYGQATIGRRQGMRTETSQPGRQAHRQMHTNQSDHRVEPSLRHRNVLHRPSRLQRPSVPERSLLDMSRALLVELQRYERGSRHRRSDPPIFDILQRTRRNTRSYRR